jgi:hypothetical protein
MLKKDSITICLFSNVKQILWLISIS